MILGRMVNEQEYLASLLVGYWEKIVVQGGKLERSPSSDAYLLSGLWFFRLGKWLEISATEQVSDAYYLSIGIMKESPVPEPSKLNRPPRKTLAVFPDDCRLDVLCTQGVEAAIGKDLIRGDDEIVFKGPLFLQTPSGDAFRILASESYPGNIEISPVRPDVGR